MIKFSGVSRLFALTAFAMTLSAGASATPTYGDIAAPGVYFGSGNVNGNWTIDTSNGIEVALRVKDRATLATIDGSGGVYGARPGQCNPTCSGGAKANWNYEFSVNTRAGGGTSVLSDYIVLMEVDIDASAAFNWVSLNVLTNWGDNDYWNGAKSSSSVGAYGVQQSANPLFGDSGFGFLPGTGTYGLRLSVYEVNATAPNGRGDLLASTSTLVQIPEPGSLALVGLGLLGAAAMRRRQAALA